MEAEVVWVDLAFALDAATGCQIANDYALMLAQSIRRLLPWWSTEPNAGVHPLKALSACGGALLIGGRTQLMLRVPETRVVDCAQLAGQAIDLGTNLGKPIRLGEPRVRALLAHPVIYSSCVSTGCDNEAEFVSYVRQALDTLNISGQQIVGKQSALQAESGRIVGFSLMVAGLSLENSLRVQQQGLGHHRALGCGLFIPHRSINAVGL